MTRISRPGSGLSRESTGVQKRGEMESSTTVARIAFVISRTQSTPLLYMIEGGREGVGARLRGAHARPAPYLGAEFRLAKHARARLFVLAGISWGLLEQLKRAFYVCLYT